MTTFHNHPARVATFLAAMPVLFMAACMVPIMFRSVFEAVLVSVARSVH